MAHCIGFLKSTWPRTVPLGAYLQNKMNKWVALARLCKVLFEETKLISIGMGTDALTS